MNHTPGPWTATSYDTADGDEGGTVLHRITAHAAGAAVADQVFTEADARLIAAAPAMIEALRVIAENGPVGPDDDPERHSQTRKYLRALKLARAALAKATGR